MSSSIRKINLKTSKCPLAHLPTFSMFIDEGNRRRCFFSANQELVSIIICMFAEKRNTSMKSEVYKRQKPFAG